MAQVNLRVDDSVKARAESVCADMGMSMTTAINIFLVKLANERRIPFEVAVDPFYNSENLAVLEKRVAELKSGKRTLKEHELIEVDE